jgi:hypothetical protein
VSANEFAARKSRQPSLTKSRCFKIALPEKVFVGAGRRLFLAANSFAEAKSRHLPGNQQRAL